MKINNLDNPFFIILLCLFSVLINVFSSVYFFPILLLGVLFMAFFVCLKKRYYYSLTLVIMSILSIELNNGFRPLSVVLLSLFIYIFIAPNIKRTLSLSSLNSYIYISVFYFGLYFLWILNNEITTHLNIVILINLIIDFLIFGVFI